MTRTRAQALGLTLFPDPRYASPAVTALRPPTGIDASRLIQYARDELGVEFAGGQGALSGKIIRIGHLGYVHEADLHQALNALERVLKTAELVTTAP